MPIETAFSKSTSSNIKFGDLPPNSSETLLMLSAAVFWISMPALVEPVNEIISRSGCLLIAFPTIAPWPCIKLNMPLGMLVS